MKIVSVRGEEIIDSRGNPTVGSVVILEDGSQGWAYVPSGASTGIHEALELRDNDPKRYNGQGVLKAVDNINTKILNVVKNLNAEDQEKIDKTMIELDGTDNKSNLGANAILAVSLAVARAEAISEKKPLYVYMTKFNPDFKNTYTMPIPQMNVLNGGRHGDFSTDIQEYMLMPIGAKSIEEGVRFGAEVYFHLKKILKDYNYSVAVGDEGGFTPAVASNEEPLELLSEAIKNSGHILGREISFAIDSASSEFYDDGGYTLNKENKTYSSEELANFYNKLSSKYPIVSWEDGFDQDDWEGFKKYTQREGNRMQVVGDDLYVTNVKRLERGVKEKTTNSILIKLNQVGTLTETINAILMARKNNMTSIISHRSGETEDTFIADLAVALGTGQIKTGSLARSERLAKYNRLMSIERELNGNSSYAYLPQK